MFPNSMTQFDYMYTYILEIFNMNRAYGNTKKNKEKCRMSVQAFKSKNLVPPFPVSSRGSILSLSRLYFNSIILNSTTD